MYEIKQQFIKFNRSNETLISQGGVAHETANPGDSDEGETNYFNTGNRSASAHAFIDSDSITQNIPWDEVAWGAGPIANHKFWHIEMCHTSDPVKFNEIWKRTVWLWAYLFTKQVNPPITKVNEQNLMSHAQVSDTWHETDHTDPVAYFASFGVTMQQFRVAVQKCIDTGIIDDLKTGGILMIIKRGDQGQAVTELQDKLNKLGYGLGVDGDFGPATETAVRSFQLGNVLVVDGVVGPNTLSEIDSMVHRTQEPAQSINWEKKYNELVAKYNDLTAEIKALINKYERIG